MPLFNIGLVGTGYAAKVRAETIDADPTARLVAVAGNDPDRTSAFSQPFAAEPMTPWKDLVKRTDIDLVIISTINRDHGAIARAAIESGKHVVVEYPLSLDITEARTLLALSKSYQRLLHVEHIELLSGIHQAIATALPEIGTPFYVRYASVNPQRPAPQKWTYYPQLFGFPFVGALSRVNRLLHLFGAVSTVTCQSQFWTTQDTIVPVTHKPYRCCMCTAQLRFANGLIADLVYGKGEMLWNAERGLDIHGDRGMVKIDGNQGQLIQPDATRDLDMGSRRGLFASDTQAVLKHLADGSPLYTTAAESVYALIVADAMRRSAEIGQTIHIDTNHP